MLYLNQLEYPDIKYPTNVKEPGCDLDVNGNIKDAGCGICSACMMVDRLCTESLNMEECIKMSIDAKANLDPGTEMKFLAPPLAERFNLDLVESDNYHDMIDGLRNGGCAIVNVGGDYDGHHGLFTRSGHFIVAVSYRDGEFLILDPSWSEGKFQEEGRKGQVREEGFLIYAKPEVVDADAANRSPRYYIFTRKEDKASK